MIKKYLYLIGITFLFSCSKQTPQENKLTNQIRIDLNGDQRKESVDEFIHDFKVDFINDSVIPIEGYPDKIIEYDDGLILVDSKNAQEIYVLNNKLHVINIINAFGGGPKEYLEIYDVIYIAKKEKLVIMDLKKMIEYDLDGKFLRSVPFNYNPDRLDYFDNNYIVWNDSRPLEQGNFHRYNLLNNDYGLTASQIPFKSIEEKFNREPASAVFQNKNAIYFSSWMNDTLYYLNKKNHTVNKLLLDFQSKSAKDIDLSTFTNASQVDEYNERNRTILWEYPAMLKDYFLSVIVDNGKVKVLLQNLDNGSYYLSPSNMNMFDLLILEALMEENLVTNNSIKFLAEIELIQQLFEVKNESERLHFNEKDFEKHRKASYAIVTINLKDKL
ncbi:hypothetical protein MATR_02500 [Marivirga tractuosa]|uniref:6-bladed beta-propeller protein n=1 Tax=Marivirga tractuosa (strain ATCC 23168 / DSM 4126 / NBRC 15989 / NCIMB 1408 / VKM B-1430 / H-43) TaxID=643867 RepID=E4TV20_MARTH|nr:6-bladed beta-propeller [Marivirga tractuosa]ADR22113.1 hypothetical protein Ftrac_2131 [Marivirga tractuosa DSM 4126]BDD13425.1 hypothetical protein MATR_02500 [Marivirga tractuosa]